MNDSYTEVPEHAFGWLLGLEGTVYRKAATSPNLGTELQIHDQGVLGCTDPRVFFWLLLGLPGKGKPSLTPASQEECLRDPVGLSPLVDRWGLDGNRSQLCSCGVAW